MPTQTADNLNTRQSIAAGSGTADNLNTSYLAAQTPAAPTDLTALPLDTAATITWTAPLPLAGVEIMGYIVRASRLGVTLTYTLPAAWTDAVLASLDNDVTWVLSITAVSGLLESAPDVASVTPNAAAGPPPDEANIAYPANVLPAPPLVLATPGDTEALIEWLGQAGGGTGITNYEISLDDGVNPPLVYTAGAENPHSLLITELINGIEYTVLVRGANEIGWSDYSDPVTVQPQAGLPPIHDPHAPPPIVVIPQPVLYAFPQGKTLRPSNWMLPPEEADLDVPSE